MKIAMIGTADVGLVKPKKDAELDDKPNFFCREPPGVEGVFFDTTGLPAWTNAPENARVPRPDIVARFPDGLADLGNSSKVLIVTDVKFEPCFFLRGVLQEYFGIKTRDTMPSYVGPHGRLLKQEKLSDLCGDTLAVARALT